MLNIRLATVSLNQTPLDWKGNTERILEALRYLASAPDSLSGTPDVILFPELSLTGYGCEDAFHSLDVLQRAMEKLIHIAHESRRILPGSLIFVGLPIRHNDFIYNCMAALYNGEVRGIIPKQNLAGDGVHYEPRWFAYFRGEGPETMRIDNNDVLFGALLLEFKQTKIVVEICEDAWTATRPALYHVGDGADIVLNPAASHFALGKQEIRRNIALESSRALCTTFVMVNLMGNEAGRLIYDGGSIIATNGRLLLETERFSFKDIMVCETTVDVEENRVQRARIFSYREQKLQPGAVEAGKCHVVIQTREELSHTITGFGFKEESETSFHPGTERTGERESPFHAGIFAPASTSSGLPEAEFLHAVTMGLFDYVRKSGARGFVISLSGGADSSASLLLLQRMILYSVYELGVASVLQRLRIESFFDENERETMIQKDNFGGSQQNRALREITDKISRRILHTIYQSTENSGEVTRNAAQRLAEALHVDHHEYDVQPLLDLYREGMEQVLERTLEWEKDDLSLQNIQARVRAPMAWFFANTTGSLLITTSNRSEAAVGYCTMDGDTSGGLAPIAGVSKAFLLQWLVHMEKTGDILGGPESSLRFVNNQKPTAELRPPSSTQTDETDLMPYELLDRIEKLAVRDRKSPLDLYRILSRDSATGAQYSPEELKEFIVRFFLLWSRNQWKRERYAPSFHLDDENLDPRSWYRFPILSGGYEEELQELRGAE